MSFSEVSNEAVFAMAEEGNHEACKERLVRHIMVVREIEYDAAAEELERLKAVNLEVLWMIKSPYYLGIGTALASGIASIPMVFDLTTAKWFNHHYVTADVPEPRDLETWLEVGCWTWNWMEPATGTACFVLLAMQFSRAQMQNMDLKPYTDFVKTWRANRLADKFPEYDRNIVKDYARTQSFSTSRVRQQGGEQRSRALRS